MRSEVTVGKNTELKELELWGCVSAVRWNVPERLKDGYQGNHFQNKSFWALAGRR